LRRKELFSQSFSAPIQSLLDELDKKMEEEVAPNFATKIQGLNLSTNLEYSKHEFPSLVAADSRRFT
jgi:hypothetical protein